MNDRLSEVWVYLAATPLLGLTATLLVYQGAFMVYRRCGFHPLANPVAVSVMVVPSIGSERERQMRAGGVFGRSAVEHVGAGQFLVGCGVGVDEHKVSVIRES